MGEVTLLSLLIGSLGLQAVVGGGWLRRQQLAMQQACEEEEETLTPYESNDTVRSTFPQKKNGLGKPPKDPRLVGWEFKIVRSQRDTFRDSAMLKHLCEEEAQAGWILLEKLDDRRIRFKRPIALREIVNSEMLAIDPYRSHYGPAGNSGFWVMAIVSLVLLVLPAYLGFMLVSTTLNQRPSEVMHPIPKGSPSLDPSEPEQ
ncbi:MAG: hypothetical protein HC780_21390 [Leptolyngbyaceae cyanobacterium CSU_1_3]|nr:hypothetical protein [Leptolyngbyaceae cyanobacterium CSU_1_3]